MLTIQFLCPLPNGLHARPAWELKEQCSQWQSEVTFINHRQNAKADAKSSLALIGTGTLFNDSCSLNISGSDEEQSGACWKSTSSALYRQRQRPAYAGRTDGASAAAFIKPP